MTCRGAPKYCLIMTKRVQLQTQRCLCFGPQNPAATTAAFQAKSTAQAARQREGQQRLVDGLLTGRTGVVVVVGYASAGAVVVVVGGRASGRAIVVNSRASAAIVVVVDGVQKLAARVVVVIVVVCKDTAHKVSTLATQHARKGAAQARATWSM